MPEKLFFDTCTLNQTALILMSWSRLTDAKDNLFAVPLPWPPPACGTVTVCPPPSQSKDTVLKGHSDSVDQICWSPTHPNQLVSASGDKTVKVWDVRGGWGKT